MNKITQLFVRACKSDNEELRLQSVYRRFYLIDNGYTGGALVPILADIVEKYKLLTIPKLMENLSPRNAWNYNGELLCTNDPRLGVLISAIRYSRVEDFDGLSSPLKIRRMQGELPPKLREYEEQTAHSLWGDTDFAT
jgi:hypothetical protein